MFRSMDWFRAIFVGLFMGLWFWFTTPAGLIISVISASVGCALYEFIKALFYKLVIGSPDKENEFNDSPQE